jgi:hypothetical protein
VRLFIFCTFVTMALISKILSAFLIPTILWAGMGFSLNRHYCLGMLVDEAWYHVSDECLPDHNDQSDTCDDSIETFGSCCSDLWISIEALAVNSQLDREELIELSDLRFTKRSLIDAQLNKVLDDIQQWQNLLDYSPHLHYKNKIIVDNQQFLI